MRLLPLVQERDLAHGTSALEPVYWPSSSKTPSKLISLDFTVPGPHAHRMIFLLMIVLAQFLTLVVFVWFNRAAWIRILVLRQQLAGYKHKSKKPMLRNRDRLFRSLISRIRNDWRSELFLVK